MRDSVLRCVIAAFLSCVLASSSAFACGGLFCSANTPVPAPVDQIGERILFEVDPSGTCTTVQISYEGTAANFAWLLPMPSVPEIGEGDQARLNAIDAASAQRLVLPDPCAAGSAADAAGTAGCSSGCEEFDESAFVAVLEERIDIVAEVETANYEVVVVEAEDANDVVLWLQFNDYNVSANMIPGMQPYLDYGMPFLAAKVKDGRDVAEIEPLRLCYPGEIPVVPLQLTAVAALPGMHIEVFILADRPYAPFNFAALPIDSDAVVHDGERTSYLAWMARAVAEAGGHGWVAEYVGDAPEGESLRYLSRYATRMNPEHMTDDPVFVPKHEMVAVDNVLDLSGRPSPTFCGGAPNPTTFPHACAMTFCGAGATCHDAAGQAGCACPEGQVAQTSVTVAGRSVTCVPAESPLGVLPGAAGAGTARGPCAGDPCGDGECLVRAGRAACDCPDGTVAVLSGADPSCVPPTSDSTFGPGGGVEALPAAARVRGRQNAAPWLLVLLIAWWWRRRR